MRTSITAVWALAPAVSLLGLYACTTVAPTHPSLPTPFASTPDYLTQLSQRIERAYGLQKASRTAEADKLVSSVIADPAFSSLSPNLQHWALQFEAILALQNGERSRAYELLIRSSTMSSSDENDCPQNY